MHEHYKQADKGDEEACKVFVFSAFRKAAKPYNSFLRLLVVDIRNCRILSLVCMYAPYCISNMYYSLHTIK